MITITRGQNASANLKRRSESAGFALTANAVKPAVWSQTVSVAQPFQLLTTAVRASGHLSPGKITAWRYDSSPY